MGPEALIKEKIKQRRHREGYEEGVSTSHKTASALSFLVSNTPVQMLGQVGRPVFVSVLAIIDICKSGIGNWRPGGQGGRGKNGGQAC